MQSPREIYVWQLQLDGAKGLEHAFQSLMQAEDLDDCSVEPDDLSIRFTATAQRGRELVASIYELGELRWCSRHAIRPGAPVGSRARRAIG